jgi:hypothetical protein
MEFCSTVKKNETMSFAEKWMEPEIMMLNEISQSNNDKYQMSSLVCWVQGERGKDIEVKYIECHNEAPYFVQFINFKKKTNVYLAGH